MFYMTIGVFLLLNLLFLPFNSLIKLMKIQANSIQLGSYIMFNNDICKVIDKTHTKPGKGHAYVLNGIKVNHKYCSSDTVESVYITKKTYNFSYEEKNIIHLTEENDPCNVIEITSQSISKKNFEYLKNFGLDNLIYVEFADEEIIDLYFNNAITTTVTWAESYIKGQTVSASYKKAKICDDAYEILVPVYIEKDNTIIINLYGDNGIEFVKRVN